MIVNTSHLSLNKEDNLSFTIDTKADYLRVKKFIKLNNCIPGTNNMSKYSQKKFLNQ